MLAVSLELNDITFVILFDRMLFMYIFIYIYFFNYIYKYFVVFNYILFYISRGFWLKKHILAKYRSFVVTLAKNIIYPSIIPLYIHITYSYEQEFSLIKKKKKLKNHFKRVKTNLSTSSNRHKLTRRFRCLNPRVSILNLAFDPNDKKKPTKTQ